jgi:hypothetical protein
MQNGAVPLGRRVLAGLDLRWLGALWAIDLVLIVLHVAWARGDNAIWSLTRDRSAAELWRDVQLAGAALYAWHATRRGGRDLSPWAAGLVYIALDDLLRIHESVGIWLTDHTPLFSSVNADTGHALGELLWLGLVAALLLAAARARHAPWVDNEATFALAACVGVLAFFGVGFDFAHSIAQQQGFMRLAFIEGAGELLAFSLVTACVIKAASR